MNLETEQALVRRAQAGDREALGELLEAHSAFLHKLALKTYCLWETREDLYQIAAFYFVKLLRKVQTERGLRLTTFLYPAIAKFVHQEARRSSVVRRPMNRTAERLNSKAITAAARMPTIEVDGPFEPADARESHVETICREEEMSNLRQAIEALPQRERLIVHLRLDGLTLAEVGAQLGVGGERIRQIETRAHRTIAERLLKSNV